MFWKLVAGVKLFVAELKKDNVGAFAGQSAFFVLLSFIPFMMVFISMIQYTPIEENYILEIVELAPAYITPFLAGIVSEVYSKSIGILSVSAVAAVWSAAKAVQVLSDGLNTVYNIPETRGWLKLRIRAAIYMILFLLAMVLCLILLMFGSMIQQQLAAHFPFVGALTRDILEARMLILTVGLVLFFLVLFKTLPNRKVKLLSQLPGAVLATAGWYAISWGISIYVGEFNGFSMYGSLTTLVLIMFWVYFCMYILLVSAEVNSLIGEKVTQHIRQKRKNHAEAKREKE